MPTSQPIIGLLKFLGVHLGPLACLGCRAALLPWPKPPFRAQKSPRPCGLGLGVWRLAIPYFRTANCRTIIGARRFHFRVRDGIGWFTSAMVTKQFGVKSRPKAQGPTRLSPLFAFALPFFAQALRPRPCGSCAGKSAPGLSAFLFRLGPFAFCLLFGNLYVLSLALALSTLRRRRRFGLFCLSLFALRLLFKPIGCYRVKPHGQLVRVSCTHCCASTPRLSTSWSPTALQGASSPSENSSWEGLPA